MFSAYLLKTEPSEYSFADLQRDGSTDWEGVSNPTAVKHLREMKPGAKLVIYETGDKRTAVGTASVTSVVATDPKKADCHDQSWQAASKTGFTRRIENAQTFRRVARS